MMQLLDLLPIIERRIPDTSRVLPDPVIPDSIPQDTAQQLANADIIGNMQQLADVLPLPGHGGGNSSYLLWTIAVVLFALFLCFNFAKKYRSKKMKAEE